MKKFLKYLFFLSLAILVGCNSNSDDNPQDFDPNFYTYVPDDNFEQLLINLGYDSTLDDYVLTSNIINVKVLPFTTGRESEIFESSGIKSFTGIEDFISLESLDCASLGLSRLDLSNNVALKSIDCSENNLTSLDLRNLVNLESLNCSYNNLTNLQINSSVLNYLSCHENQLSSLDIGQSDNLLQLACFSNSLSTLDLSNNLDLETVQASSNQLTKLDISNNVALTYLECQDNPLSCIKVNEEQLAYDWSFCSQSLFRLECD